MSQGPGDPENVHGTAIAIGGRGVLLRGLSGSGKSDLALRTIALSAGPLMSSQPMLVADDRVVAHEHDGSVSISCPNAIRGLIEVRGVGIVAVPSVETADLMLVVDLVPADAVQRLPDRLEPAIVCGRAIERIALAPFEASAPLKLVLALQIALARRL